MKGSGSRTKMILLTGALLLSFIIPSGCQKTQQVSDVEPDTPMSASTESPSETVNAEPSSTPGYQDIVNPNQTYSYEQMISDARKLADQYPDLITTDSIGQSVEGREMLLLKLGTGPQKAAACGCSSRTGIHYRDIPDGNRR